MRPGQTTLETSFLGNREFLVPCLLADRHLTDRHLADKPFCRWKLLSQFRTIKLFISEISWVECYKTFYGRDLQMFVLS